MVLDLSSLFCKVGFVGEGAPRHIFRRRKDDAALNPEENMERLLREIFTRKLMCQAQNRHVLICENLAEATINREAVTKVLLQRMGAASVQLLLSPQLSLFASGLDRDISGLVLQVGYSETTVLPICYRVPLVQSASIAKLGSRTLHACLYQLALQVGAYNLTRFHVLSACAKCSVLKLHCMRASLLSSDKMPFGRIRSEDNRSKMMAFP